MDSGKHLKSVNSGVGTAALAIFLAGAVFYVSRSATMWNVARAQTIVAPFVLQMESYSFADNPEGELISRRTEARRSDGARVLMTTIGGRAGVRAGLTARKLILMDGRMMTLTDSIGAKTTWPRRSAAEMASAKRFLSNPPADCIFHPGEILLGYDLVFGQKAAIIKEPPHPDGASQQMKKWRSPLLGCQNLQYRLEARQPDGSSKLLAEGRPVSLKLGEPPAALFDEGESFAELRPSQAGALVADRLGVAYDDWERSMRRQDARYLDGSPSEPQ